MPHSPDCVCPVCTAIRKGVRVVTGDDTCKHCRWRGPAEQEYLAKKGIAECRFRAPVMVQTAPDECDGVVPLKHEDYWCGDFKSKAASA